MKTTATHKSPTFYIALALIIGALLSYLGILDLAKFAAHLNQAGIALCGIILMVRKVQRTRQASAASASPASPVGEPMPTVSDKLPRRYFNPRSTQQTATATTLHLTAGCITLCACLLLLPSCSSTGSGLPANSKVVTALAQIATTTGVQLAVQRYPELRAVAPAIAGTIREAVAADADDVQGIRAACADCLAGVVADPLLRQVVYDLIDTILVSARDQDLTNAQTESLLLSLADSLDAVSGMNSSAVIPGK